MPIPVIIVLLAFTSLTEPENREIRIMSYNIRYDNPADSANAWPNRKQDVVNLVKFYEPDFLGTQEALPHQVAYLDDQLKNMRRIGQGREGGQQGEFSALYYNAQRFELVEGSERTLWLSETPEKPSKGWDAALPRIVTFGKFRDRKSGQEIYVFNTHFDHLGETARINSARLLIQTISQVAGDRPVALTGDFNAEEDSEPYRLLTDSELRDAYYHSELPHVGPEFTFKGFRVDAPAKQEKRIDYIFVHSAVDVRSHAIISNFKGDSFTSDHLPVIADIRLEG